jgi:hypothetical protein
MFWLWTKIWPVAVFAGLLINEVSYKGTPEWVEILNDSDQSSELVGLVLKDANNSTKDDLILDGSISPHEYKVFENSKSWLNDSGDTLYLVSSTSGQVFDQVTFDRAIDGKTYGRVNGSWGFMDSTRGGSNGATVQPTSTSTPTPTVTRASTPEPTKFTPTSPPPTNKVTTTITSTPTVSPKITSIATPSGETVEELTSEVLGDTQSTEAAKVKKEIEAVSKFPYGYLLMIGGSVTSMLGLGIGYLRHRDNGVK